MISLPADSPIQPEPGYFVSTVVGDIFFFLSTTFFGVGKFDIFLEEKQCNSLRYFINATDCARYELRSEFKSYKGKTIRGKIVLKIGI